MKKFILWIIFTLFVEWIIWGFFYYQYKNGNNELINQYFGMQINEKKWNLNIPKSNIQINLDMIESNNTSVVPNNIKTVAYNNNSIKDDIKKVKQIKENKEKINKQQILSPKQVKQIEKTKKPIIKIEKAKRIEANKKDLNKLKSLNVNNLYKEYLLLFLSKQDKKIYEEGKNIIFFYELTKKEDNYNNLCKFYNKYNSFHIYNICKILTIYIRNNIKDIKKNWVQMKDYYNVVKEKLNKFNSPYVSNEFCDSRVSIICNLYKEKYLYVKKAIIANRKLKDWIDMYSKKYNIPKKVFYAILIIENIRMHTTYKTQFKALFLKYKIPQLTVMTKFSYWYFGVKLNVIYNILNSHYYKDNIDNIQNNKKIKTLKSLYDEYIKTKDTKYKEQMIKYIVHNKDLQVEIVAIFLAYQRYEYRFYWCNLNEKILNENKLVWIYATLWNIGGAKINKIKECKPKFGGANIWFYNNDIFWHIAYMLSQSIDMLYVMNR